MEARTRAPLIALLTDFGMRDWYVAALKGVILTRAPRTQLVDITHEIPPQDIIAGAFTLAAATPWFPRGTVIVAVVDPGVGSARGLLAARCDGRYLLGPDNGLLALALRAPIGMTSGRSGSGLWVLGSGQLPPALSPEPRANQSLAVKSSNIGRQATVIRLTNPRYWRDDVSRTFHGRDILAPVAAHLARGGSLARLGPPVRRIAPLALPPVEPQGRRLRGRVVHIDAFGNLMTNLSSTVLRTRRHGPVIVRYKGRRASVVSSYWAGAPNRLIAVVNALGMVELAVRNASAAAAYAAQRGDPVDLER